MRWYDEDILHSPSKDNYDGGMEIEREEKTRMRPMSNELQLYKPPAAPIRKELLKKNELTLRERLWVWNDVVGAALGSVVTIIGVMWYLLLFPQSFGLFLIAIGALAASNSITVFLKRWGSTSLALDAGQSKWLNHGERARLCLYDRNRRARPHRDAYRFADKRYSIWPDYADLDGDGKQTVLLLLQHTRPDPYMFTRILPRRFRFSQRAWFVSIPTGDAAIQYLGKHPDPHELEAARDELEKSAEVFEAKPHLDKVKDFEAEEQALELRRNAPRGSQQVIKTVRKQLNK